MKMKSVVLLAVALGCGLVAMLGVQQVLSGNTNKDVEVGQVLVAITDIIPGKPLDETNVAFKKWRKEDIPAGAVTTKEQYEDRSLRVRAFEGELILEPKLGQKGAHGASADIPDGMRVVSVKVNSTMTHSGMIQPGDRVDVMCTFQTYGASSRRPVKLTKTVLEYIRVFSLDNHRDTAAETNDSGVKNVALLVEPDQAGLLMLAESKGDLTLALRSAGDHTTGMNVKVTEDQMADIFSAGQDDERYNEMKLGTSAGSEAETEPELIVENENKKPSSVGEFIASEQSAQEPVTETKAEPQVAEANVKPETPKWQIDIYAGDEHRVEEVDLPVDLDNPLQGLLKKVFSTKS